MVSFSARVHTPNYFIRSLLAKNTCKDQNVLLSGLLIHGKRVRENFIEEDKESIAFVGRQRLQVKNLVRFTSAAVWEFLVSMYK